MGLIEKYNTEAAPQCRQDCFFEKEKRMGKSIFANLDHLNQFSFAHQQITNWIPETTGTFSQLPRVQLPLPQALRLSVLSSRKCAKFGSTSGQNLGFTAESS